jgi:hypothetical protein
VKNLACLPLFVLSAIPTLSASTVGWVNGVFIPNDAAYQSYFGSGSGAPASGVFMGALPQQVPEPEPVEAPSPSPAISPLTLTEDGLLTFVFQSLYSDLSEPEKATMRAVLAPQYAALAAHLQAQFGGLAEVPPDPAMTPSSPAPATDPVPDRPAGSVTDSMAVVATAMMLAPSPAGSPDPGVAVVDSSSLFLASAGFSALDVTAVPEPSTVLLLTAGLAGLAASRRRFPPRP